MSSKGLVHWPNGKVWVVVVALLCLVLSQCRNHTDEAASLALIAESQPGCTAPCWLGVVPGVSTEAAVVDVIEANPERFADLKRNAPSPHFAQYIWRDPVLDGLLSLELESDVVTHIYLQTEPDLSLQLAFEQLGTPDRYASYLLTGERLAIILYIFYTDLGITLETEVSLDQVQVVDCHYVLPDAVAVNSVYLAPKAAAQDTLARLPHPPPGIVNSSAWSGPNGLALASCPP